MRTSKRPQAAPDCAKTVENEAIGIRRQNTVAMQEHQNVARRRRGAGIHLLGTAARGGENAIGQRPRQIDRAVAAAAIHDNHLDTARAIIRKPRQRAADIVRFIEDRQNDRQCRHQTRGFACSTS